MVVKNRLVDTFIDLVSIDSPSGEEKKIADFVAHKLKALGANVLYDKCGNVIAKLEGVGEPMLLSAHLDTVEPGRNIKPQVTGNKITSNGTTILGGDNKGGVACILETITSLKENKSTHVPLEIVFTLGEEAGLKGALNLDYNLISAKRGINFDGEYDVTHVTTSAPGYNCVDVNIFGRSAHAGAAPEKGISAIKVAAEIITKLEVGRIDHETTANIGFIEGGSTRNTVPEKVHFKAEIRSRNIEKLEKHSSHFEQVFKSVLTKHPEVKVELNIHREFNPYLFEENHRVIQLAVKTLRDMGLKAKLEPAGGGTDVNIFHTHGIETIVVGGCFYEAHTTREYVVISEMVKAAEFCERVVSAY